MPAHHINGHPSTCSTGHRQGGDDVSSAPEPDRYAIRVKGHLAERWAAWFDGMTLTRRADGTTVLDGPVVDQSALHGLLRKVGDLGLPLVSVTPTPAIPTSTAPEPPRPVDDDE
jgi:hypothetical protein